jgi:hypothetical protein
MKREPAGTTFAEGMDKVQQSGDIDSRSTALAQGVGPDSGTERGRDRKVAMAQSVEARLATPNGSEAGALAPDRLGEARGSTTADVLGVDDLSELGELDLVPFDDDDEETFSLDDVPDILLDVHLTAEQVKEQVTATGAFEVLPEPGVALEANRMLSFRKK